MELHDQKIVAAIEAIWEEAEVLFENNDPARYALKLEEAWELLPAPKEVYDESYHIALAIAETYFILKDFPAMLRWANTLQQCDPARADDGECEFVLGKARFENGDMKGAEEYFTTAMHKSAGRVFEGVDEKYLHVFSGLATVVEEELPADIHEKVEALSEAGNELADADDFDGAIARFTEALQLLPEPARNWEASTWLYASIGDMYYFKGNYEAAANSFYDALNGPDAQANGFVNLRLGESLYELNQHDQSLEYLLRAYMLEGKEIFAEEDPRYFIFLKTHVKL
ncbi:tetratricopeptide (TPR) repeat protein [Chitinophaga sp. W2I13]|uniref:tetratricopeptide repeat protein n=1 Tax=Chitinophaga sp. W2I13 TaxID=3373923 RepID=UPI003D195DC2